MEPPVHQKAKGDFLLLKKSAC